MPNPNSFHDGSSGSFVFDDDLQTQVATLVYVKQRWADTWVLQHEINVTDVRWNASPGVSTATLIYRYGPSTRRDGSGSMVAENRPKLSIGGYFIKIVVDCGDGDRVWIGYVDDTIDDASGVMQFASAVVPTGTQTFSCLGILAALGRSKIMQSYYRTTSAFQGPNLTERRVSLSAPYFNPQSKITDEPGEKKQIKNRTVDQYAVTDLRPSGASYSFQTRDTYLLYCETLYNQTAAGEFWTTKQIVDYLVAYHGPRDANGKERIPIWLDSTAAACIPTWDRPELNCDGKTLKDALDELLSSRKSLGYSVYVDETQTPHRVVIFPFTTTEANVTIGSNTLLANANRIDVVTQNDAATSYNIQRTESEQANQIICKGAKRVAIVTLELNQIRIRDGWEASLLTEFNTETAALGLTLKDQYAKQDLLEQGKYRPLYRHFSIGRTWDWKYDDGVVTTDLFEIDTSDFTKSYTTGDRYLPFGYSMKVLGNLPLKSTIDYSTGDKAADHLASFAAFRDIEVYGLGHPEGALPGTMTGRAVEWTHRAKRDVVYDINDPDYYLTTRPIQSDLRLGIEIEVVNAPQAVLANSVSLSSSSGVLGLPRSSLLVTLAFEEDRCITQHWPDTASSSLDSVLQKVFDFGDAYQQIEMMENTIVGLNTDGTFKRRDTRWFVRDDRPALLDLAKQIAKWYSAPRNIARIRSRRATAMLWPGQLIEQINPGLAQEFTSNCVITEVSMTFAIGTADSPGKNTMSITTSKGEFDPRFFVPKLRS